jgi:hypothetical protein
MPPVVPFTRPLYPPSHAKGPVPDDVDIVAVKRAVSRAGYWPWQDFDDSYSQRFADDGVAGFQYVAGIDPTGNYGQATHEALRTTNRKGSATEWAFDPVSIRLMEQAAAGPPAPQLPALGAVCVGGVPVLNQDLTHETSGLDRFPAFDDCFGAGRTCIAPEGMVVTRVGSSRPGASIHCDGASGIRWWFGHLVSAPDDLVGRRFAKGERFGTTCVNQVGGGPHLHVGCNVERIWGAGRQLLHHTNYTHGAPLIGRQLALAGKLDIL